MTEDVLMREEIKKLEARLDVAENRLLNETLRTFNNQNVIKRSDNIEDPTVRMARLEAELMGARAELDTCRKLREQYMAKANEARDLLELTDRQYDDVASERAAAIARAETAEARAEAAEEAIKIHVELSEKFNGGLAAEIVRLQADAKRLRAALEEIRNKRGVAPYDVARKALSPDEQRAESEGE